jgi:uncharacterized membrane protein YgcG
VASLSALSDFQIRALHWDAGLSGAKLNAPSTTRQKSLFEIALDRSELPGRVSACVISLLVDLFLILELLLPLEFGSLSQKLRLLAHSRDRGDIAQPPLELVDDATDPVISEAQSEPALKAEPSSEFWFASAATKLAGCHLTRSLKTERLSHRGSCSIICLAHTSHSSFGLGGGGKNSSGGGGKVSSGGGGNSSSSLWTGAFLTAPFCLRYLPIAK